MAKTMVDPLPMPMVIPSCKFKKIRVSSMRHRSAVRASVSLTFLFLSFFLHIFFLFASCFWLRACAGCSAILPRSTLMWFSTAAIRFAASIPLGPWDCEVVSPLQGVSVFPSA
jgi:hypothetical protein